MTQRLKLVIVGHLDHGKSTLIGRLLFDSGSLPEGLIEEIRDLARSDNLPEFAHVMDHLQEEREQEMTIDTSQIFFRTQCKSYAIIDTPGHREFIRNMITGASQAEAAILILSASEGIKEQTKRHAYVLSMLGIRQVILAINKMDLIGYDCNRFEGLKAQALTFLHRLQIKPAYVIPISAMQGDNIATRSDNTGWYLGPSILEALDSFQITQEALDRPLRLPIQDIYQIDHKEILVGRIASGKVSKGDEVIILPSGVRTRISSVELFQQEAVEAFAGQSIGITLEDRASPRRGQIICHPGPFPKITQKIDPYIFWISTSPLRVSDDLSLRCATQETGVSVQKIQTRLDSSTLQVIQNDAHTLEETNIGKVILRLQNPLVFEDFNEVAELGRFVLLRDKTVCAGGILTRSSEWLDHL
jgi:sulfate adenylyltransferase large subunit